VVGIELERLVRFRVTAVGRLLHRRQFFVVLSQLVAQNVNVVSNLFRTDDFLQFVAVLNGLLMESLTGDVNQLFGIHVVENPFGIFAVTAAFHDGQQQFGGVVLQFENQVHSSLAQRIDVGQQESRDDVEPIRFVSSDAVLVLVARALTVFGQRFQRLVDQRCVVLVDVQTEQSQLARRRSAKEIPED